MVESYNVLMKWLRKLQHLVLWQQLSPPQKAREGGLGSLGWRN